MAANKIQDTINALDSPATTRQHWTNDALMLQAFLLEGLTEHVGNAEIATAGQARVPDECCNLRESRRAEETAGPKFSIGFSGRDPRIDRLISRYLFLFQTFFPLEGRKIPGLRFFFATCQCRSVFPALSLPIQEDKNVPLKETTCGAHSRHLATGDSGGRAKLGWHQRR
jgi:hypothetical protein